jgi:Photosynthesis affected mutant 68
MLAADEQAGVTPTAIPEPVAMRMGQRMLPFVGLPLFLGVVTFVGFWYMESIVI